LRRISLQIKATSSALLKTAPVGHLMGCPARRTKTALNTVILGL
jgi:hypothetical protein